MEKINFSGGEPFIHDRGQYLGQLVRFCKEELRLPSVSIVSNGSLIRERWFQTYGGLPGVGLRWWLLGGLGPDSFHPSGGLGPGPPRGGGAGGGGQGGETKL